MKMQPGDRVRLTPNTAMQMMGKNPKDRRFTVNWLARCGIVIRVSAPTNSATVKWDDRTTTDDWPTWALKKLV